MKEIVLARIRPYVRSLIILTIWGSCDIERRLKVWSLLT